MDNVELLQQVVDETRRVVENTKDAQLANKTLCTEWTVRDVINHVAGGSKMVAESLRTGAVSGERYGELMGGDNLGGDFRGALKAASQEALDAVREPGAMERMATLPFGEVPGAAVVMIGIFDVMTHACDIAQATGQTIDNTALLETALEVGHQTIPPEMRAPGIFDPEQAAASDAPAMARLLAFAGRVV
jgi:uncharacterized protein (TIGR03086 family)